MNNRDLYDINIVDKNIDFRRVRNLIIFFNHNFHILTNDISKIEEALKDESLSNRPKKKNNMFILRE